MSGVFGELVFGVEACFDAYGEVDFLLCVERETLPICRVVFDGVGGCACGDGALCGCVVVVVAVRTKPEPLAATSSAAFFSSFWLRFLRLLRRFRLRCRWFRVLRRGRGRIRHRRSFAAGTGLALG